LEHSEIYATELFSYLEYLKDKFPGDNLQKINYDGHAKDDPSGKQASFRQTEFKTKLIQYKKKDEK